MSAVAVAVIMTVPGSGSQAVAPVPAPAPTRHCVHEESPAAEKELAGQERQEEPDA